MGNALFGWLWILGGMLAGGLLGLCFQKDTWLGGYGSFPRRLLRLGHVACIALGALNVLFALQAPVLGLSESLLAWASGTLMVGAVAMPICCCLMAWSKKAQPLFVVPVLCLCTSMALVARGLLP